MPRGGSRPRSGPQKDPNSGRSDRARGVAKKTAAAKKATAKKTTPAKPDETDELPITSAEFDPTKLPARGRSGNPPAYPIPRITRFVIDLVDGKPAKVQSDSATAAFRKRELEIWRSQWRKPQAVAWERDPWRWERIALYCRLTTVIEVEPDSNAALISRQRELAIEHGLTPDGLKVNGWAIAPDELAQARVAKKTAAKAAADEEMPPLRLQK